MENPAEYWNKRWETGQTGWDTGNVTTPLKEYISQLQDMNLRILIPGCGNAYEAGFLLERGFRNVNVLDISSLALEKFRKRVPAFPGSNIYTGDFFSFSGVYDLILEQTFFCALDPSLRNNYVQKMQELLVPGGKVAGLLFNAVMNSDQPPYGGSEKEYRLLFQDYFDILTLETAYNSITPRAGKELFFTLRKPETGI